MSVMSRIAALAVTDGPEDGYLNGRYRQGLDTFVKCGDRADTMLEAMLWFAAKHGGNCTKQELETMELHMAGFLDACNLVAQR